MAKKKNTHHDEDDEDQSDLVYVACAGCAVCAERDASCLRSHQHLEG